MVKTANNYTLSAEWVGMTLTLLLTDEYISNPRDGMLHNHYPLNIFVGERSRCACQQRFSSHQPERHSVGRSDHQNKICYSTKLLYQELQNM